MSKSYDNTIEIFESEESLRKKIMRIVTDSTPVAEPKDPDRCNVFALLRLFAQPQELADWENRYRSGGTGYSDAKKRLAELVIDYFKPFREKRVDLEHNPAYVREVLAEGARRAASVAVETLAAARNAVGLGAHYGR
jgi:tryptophanyl-tRNA synthetase